jgi:protein XagA
MKNPSLRLTVLAVFLPLLTPAAAYAGAWAQPQGEGQVINTFSYYEVNVQGFNALGKPSGHGEYTQLEYSPYVEYGLTNRWTVGFQPRLQYVTQSGLPGTGHTLGLVQMNLFARYEVYRDDSNALSMQGQVGIPGAATGINPELAQPNAEYEGRVLYGHDFRLPNGWPAFLDVEAGYRLETDGNANQVRGDGTLGVYPSSRWTILVQSFNTVSVSPALPGDFDYNLNRVEISAVYSLTKRTAIQFGAWRDVAGKNISLGDAGIVALWYQF